MIVEQDFETFIGDQNSKFSTILADPPWLFANRTGSFLPQHENINQYPSLSLSEIMEIPVPLAIKDNSHLYLWVPNALLLEGLKVMRAWGFTYKSNIVWQKIRKDGEPDGRGLGVYFRNTTELLLFGIRGKIKTSKPAQSQVNVIRSRRREYSRKPDEQYALIEKCSPGRYLELFARKKKKNWSRWGNPPENHQIPRDGYDHHSPDDLFTPQLELPM